MKENELKTQSHDKVQKICQILKEEALQPAKQEAKELIENAHIQADEIIKRAKKEAEEITKLSMKEVENRKKSFETSLNLAARQGIDKIKQNIEKNIFSKNLVSIIQEQMANPKVIAELIKVVVEAIKKEGIDVEMSAYVPGKIFPRDINDYLMHNVLDELKEKEVLVGDFEGGAMIKLHERQITIDISSEAVKGLIAEYIRSDFRDLIFNA